MKYFNKLKNTFLKYIVLIFVFLSIFPLASEFRPVHATDFEDWTFEIKEDTLAGAGGDAQRYTINISDGNAGRLGNGTGKGEVWNELLSRYKIMIVGIMGVATLTMVVIAMVLFTKLSASAANPQERAHTVKWIGIFLIAAGLLGSVSLIFTYSFGVFRK